MKVIAAFAVVVTTLWSCLGRIEDKLSKPFQKQIAGTWRLIRGTVVEQGDTTITDYTKGISFIKIINETHFAFLQHDLNKGKGAAASFVSGGGSYSVGDSLYTEHLEYCSAREWEGNDFTFRMNIKNDTLTLDGIEKVESTGVNRSNMEKYIRVKK